jgi:hypothetical protein
MNKDCWLSPTGKVTWCGFMGQHCERAYKIIEEKGWYEEFEEWEEKNGNRYPVDFLHEEKRYARYMSWFDNPHWVLPKGGPTKRQEQRMFEIDNKID